MSECNDIAGSDDIISLNYESQETFNEHSYRTKQSANRIDKNVPMKEQAKENQKPIEQVNVEEADVLQAETQNYSQPTTSNEVPAELPPLISIDTQNTLTSNNPCNTRPPLAQSTLTDEGSVSADKEMDSILVQSPIHEEENVIAESTSKSKDVNASSHDTTTTTNNLRLYISPSTSLLETTNVDDAQPNPIHISTTENNGQKEDEEATDINDKPKEEPMDTSDAQVSLGSDGIIETHPSSALIIESTSVTEKSTTGQSPTQSKISTSPASKAIYALSQPTTDKFEAILAKLATPPVRNDTEANTTIREEEEVFIRESISKTLRRYAVKVDSNGRMLSRELLIERIVEENTTTRIESWPPAEKKPVRSAPRTARPSETIRKKPSKQTTPKRKTRSLRTTSTVASSRKAKVAQSDNDDDVIKTNIDDDDSSEDDNEEDEDDEPTDDVSGDEFIPKNSSAQSLTKGARVFAKWVDGHFYPGIIGNINGEKYGIEFDDGAKRYVRATDIVLQSYLDPDQNVMAQTQDGYFDRGIIKRLIKKKKTGKLGYIVEKNGKEKWYPLRYISMTTEQAGHLPIVNNHTEEPTPTVQGKRKRTSNAPQSPHKKPKSNSIHPSPSKNQRSTSTPTRQTKLFNPMHFLLTGFNDSMDIRNEIQNAVEGHGGKVIEKIPNANRRENVYLISDKTRKTAKFFDAKKFNIPCVSYTWINESVEKGEVQDWNAYKLVLPEKETKDNED